ncbi:hypothetical protein B0H67DRAFT_569382 [Lasiosphaeris hirsuta]|uniref:Uncharacterized protein n=1 Tax=Lasiosphaeris hirsuta TaxID=260670 RepID=A0AA40AZY2_9PEZI|nr:hypothetical protein B0H67DRAFT_569382 [Lasiosphaeris hirsuta]
MLCGDRGGHWFLWASDILSVLVLANPTTFRSGRSRGRSWGGADTAITSEHGGYSFPFQAYPSRVTHLRVPVAFMRAPRLVFRDAFLQTYTRISLY